MIYYATQQTLERYKLSTPENFQSEMGDIVRMIANKERGNRLYEWGCKLFYFDRRKCLQVVHFESKLTIFLIDIKMDDKIKIICNSPLTANSPDESQGFSFYDKIVSIPVIVNYAQYPIIGKIHLIMSV